MSVFSEPQPAEQAPSRRSSIISTPRRATASYSTT
ncbi:hypothetical protein ACN47E_008172 [Coniothyrium glycines]